MEYIESGFSIIRSPLLYAHQDRWAEELKSLMYNMHSKVSFTKICGMQISPVKEIL